MKTAMRFLARASLLPLALLAGCSPAEKAAETSAVSAPPRIETSFEVAKVVEKAADPLSVKEEKDKFTVSIAKASLEKEFLLQGNLVSYDETTRFGGLKSRIVAFRKRAGKLYLIEATAGHVVSQDTPETFLLTEFAILSETDDMITFDFNAGMRSLFTDGDLSVAPKDSVPGHSNDLTTTGVRMSYLDRATVNTERNELDLRQIAQISQGGAVGSVEVRYYLSPYRPDPGFVPTVPADKDLMGFFAAQPLQLINGGSTQYSAKFNAKKPIVYAISDNTPAEYRQAIRDGVLYWNKAFGEERVQVIDAPAGVRAPDSRYNVLQWIPQDDVGFAYADLQMDPRTGETLHAQIYLTSAFPVGGKYQQRALERGYRARRPLEGPKPAPAPAVGITLRGFEAESLCDLHQHAEHATDLQGVPADKALAFAQDIMRANTAHEVGHTLGMRHNFAGSMGASYTLNQRQGIVDAYLETSSAPKGLTVTSSIMDYFRSSEKAMSGNLVAHGGEAFDYDRKAIQSLYYGKRYTTAEMPLYCTDDDADREYFDCYRFDFGQSPIEFFVWETQQTLDKLPNSLIEEFVNAKTPFRGKEVKPVARVGLDAASWAEKILEGRIMFFASLHKIGAYFKVRRNFGFINSSNEEAVKKAEADYLASEITRLGGLDKLLMPLVKETYPATLSERFASLVTDEAYRSGTGKYETPFSFTDEERQTMQTTVDTFGKRLLKEIRESDIQILSDAMLPGVFPFVDHELSYEIISALEKRAISTISKSEAGKEIEAEVLFTAAPVASKPAGTPVAGAPTPDPAAPAAPPTAPVKMKIKLKLPKFAYPIESRIKAALMLSSARGHESGWGVVERARMFKWLIGSYKLALGGLELGQFDLAEMPRPVAAWMREARVLIAVMAKQRENELEL